MVSSEGQTLNGPGVSGPSVQLLTRGNVPEFESPVGATRSQALAVRAENHRRHQGNLVGSQSPQLACRRHPQTKDTALAIASSQGNRATVGTEGDAPQLARRPTEGARDASPAA